MYKQANLNFSVAAQAYGTELTTIQFNTQDKNSAKLVFTIKEGKEPVNLTDVDGKVTLYMGDKSLFEGMAKVTEPLNGVLEYTITPEQIRHAGKVVGELTLTNKDGSSVGGFRFNFKITKALVDEHAGPTKEYYIEDLEAVKQEVQKKAETIHADIETIKTEVDQKTSDINNSLITFETDIDQRTSAVEELVNGFESNIAETTVVQVNAAKTDSSGQAHADIDGRIKAEVGRINQKQEQTTAALAGKVDEVVQDGSDLKFYAKDKLLYSVNVTEAGNAEVVQSYIDTLVSNGQIEGVTLAEGAVTPRETSYIDVAQGTNKLNPNTVIKDFYKTGSSQVSHSGAFYSGNINVKSGDIVRCTYNSTYATNIGVVYDKNNVATLIRSLPDFAIVESKYWSATMPENASHIIINGSFGQIANKVMVTINEPYPSAFIAYTQEYKLNQSIKFAEKSVETSNLSDEVIAYFQNLLPTTQRMDISPLNNKKWAVCGDSITYGAQADLDADGNRKTYEYYIRKRNNMNLTINAISGSTMMNVSGKNPFSVAGRYDSLGTELDYITLAFGTNDSAQGAESLGTINDTTNATFYGAWNVVMDYLITKYPKTKIGILIFWGGSKTYRDAVREIAKKYGIPPLDFLGDMSIPLFAGKEEGMGVNFNIKEARKATFLADGLHPNDTGYQYLSTIIEDYLRRL